MIILDRLKTNHYKRNSLHQHHAFKVMILTAYTIKTVFQAILCTNVIFRLLLILFRLPHALSSSRTQVAVGSSKF